MKKGPGRGSRTGGLTSPGRRGGVWAAPGFCPRRSGQGVACWRGSGGELVWASALPSAWCLSLWFQRMIRSIARAESVLYATVTHSYPKETDTCWLRSAPGVTEAQEVPLLTHEGARLLVQAWLSPETLLLMVSPPQMVTLPVGTSL